MKTDFHFKLISRIVVLAILVVVVFAMQRSVDTVAEDTPIGATPIAGWAWSQVTGWVSLNCLDDWDGDQFLEDRCIVPYNLALDRIDDADEPNITGCAWSGNNAGGGGKPLGWICFSDVGGTGGPLANGVPTSTVYTNALLENDISNSYASILAFAGVSADATKIGFPILGPDVSGTIDENNKINGCFNCFTTRTYGCQITGAYCDPCAGGADSCEDLINCPPVGDDPPVADLCVIRATEDHCDNCLDYDYYSGRCEDGGGGGSHDVCQNQDDCTGIETCEQISTCIDNGDEDCTDNALICTGDEDDCIERDIGELKSVIGGYDCHQCEIANFDNTVEMSSYDTNINKCSSCDIAHNTPGVMFDNQNGYIGSCEQLGDQIPGCVDITPNCDLSQDDMQAEDFCERVALGGWGWNAWDELGETHGLGWFQFSPRITTSSKPYFSVERGSIYALDNIFGRYEPPFGRSNATYLIESGGAITNFVSSSTISGHYQGELDYRPGIDFLNKNTGPDENEKYDNVLGNLDVEALIANYDGAGHNKFGSEVTINESSFFNSGPLLAKVFYVAAPSYTPPVNTTINRGNGGENASGIVVIDGDLIINNDIVYDTNSVSNLVEIPSIVWIVRGDIVVGGGVDKIVGTFIALGDDDISCSPYIVDEDGITISARNGCGRFDTCDQDVGCNNQLKVTGNVLAKQFDMGRDFRNTDKEPSELFQNDGRLQANPPLGLTDFSKVIPRFTDNPY